MIASYCTGLNNYNLIIVNLHLKLSGVVQESIKSDGNEFYNFIIDDKKESMAIKIQVAGC